MTQSKQAKLELAELLHAKEQHLRYHKIETIFPDKGKYARKFYSKHVEFMAKGATHSQRAFIAANRCGKTFTGGFEVTCHLTGIYPDWWKGHRFDNPIEAWAAGKSNILVRDTLQKELLGDMLDLGSGMIPKHLIVGKPISKAGIAGGIGVAYIKHISGGTSRLDFMAYEQGREGFQGSKKQFIWLDEEPRDKGIFTECLTRTAGDVGEEGLIILTFTPLYGLSNIVLSFMPMGQIPHDGVHPDEPWKYITQVTWDEVVHISEAWKQSTLKSYSNHEREARSRGIPSLGAGAIYPYFEDDYVIEPREIPFWWPRFYGLDWGWNKTAAVWIAIDPESNTKYIYNEYYAGQKPIVIHAAAIKARGDWIIGAMDPSAWKNRDADGKLIIQHFGEEGVNLEIANNSIEAGLLIVQQLFETGNLKVFSTCQNFLTEIRTYHRNEQGKIVEGQPDHLLDALRYAMITGVDYAMTKPDEDDDLDSGHNSGQGRNQITGY